MFSGDADAASGALRDGKDRVIASVVALASANDIRLLRGGGTVFPLHGLISPRVTPFTAFIVDPDRLTALTHALVEEGWRRVPLAHSPRLLPTAIVRLARDDFDGLIHLHGVIPGFFADPVAVFDLMWRNRLEMVLAGIPVPVLDRLCTVMLATHDRLAGREYRRAMEGENFSYLVTQFRAVLSANERLTLARKVGTFGADDELRSLLEGLAMPVGPATRPSEAYVRLRLGLDVATAGDIWVIEHLERPRSRREHGIAALSIAGGLLRLLGARRRVARRER